MDARTRAAMGAALELKADEPACPSRTRLAALNARRDALKAHLKKEKTRLQQTSDTWIRADIKSLLAILERRVLKVEAEIASAIKANADLTRLDNQLQSAPGIGKIVSAVLIGKLPDLHSSWTVAFEFSTSGFYQNVLTQILQQLIGREPVCRGVWIVIGLNFRFPNHQGLMLP